MREATVPIAIVRVSRARPRGLAVMTLGWLIPDRLQTTDGRSVNDLLQGSNRSVENGSLTGQERRAHPWRWKRTFDGRAIATGV
jgi:hypothetical protein